MISRGGIHTVTIDGEHVDVAELDAPTLRRVWADKQREVNELYRIMDKVAEGSRGRILRLLGIQLPTKRGRFVIPSSRCRNRFV